MAGMDWFRWHHGSVTDPKFQLVARKTKSRVADVIAVWAFILEEASQSDDRGAHGDLDFESIDCALGLDDGQAQAIHAAMIDRLMITSAGRVAAWDKRQPKREREDGNSTERSRALRLRRSQGETSTATLAQTTPVQAIACHATPCNAMQRQETPRVEKSREEKIKTGGERVREPLPAPEDPAADADTPPIFDEYRQIAETARPDLNAETVWAAFCEHYPAPKRGRERWRKWVMGEAKPQPFVVAYGSACATDYAVAALADPDSRASVEAIGLARGMGRWDQLKEPWATYKSRIKTATAEAVQ